MLDIRASITQEASSFLTKIMPLISDSWWQDMVLSTLNPRQKDILLKSKDTTLDNLDIAALLRILDQNWFRISAHMEYEPEQRHYLKEMISIRNRWAHRNSNPISDDDLYRDLDTAQRFLKMINADSKLIDDIQLQKQEVFKGRTQERVHSTEQKSTEGFHQGQVVRLKSSPDKHFAVVSILSSEPENRIDVF